MVWRTVLRNELRLLLADRGLLAALVLFAGLFAYALANGSAWASRMERTVEAVRAADLERADKLTAELERIEGGGSVSPFRDPRSPSVMGGKRWPRSTALPPGPLAALAVGQSDLLPYYYDIQINTNDQSFLQNGEVENPLNLMVGRFDLAFLLVYLLPLVILGLAYDALSGERERGTLALTLSQPVSARSVVGARLLFRALVVLGLALGASLLGAVLTGGLAAPAQLALWCLAAAVYALFWFGLAAWVNTLGRTSAWNATALVGAWLVLVVVLPATLNIAANLLHPLPSRVEMIGAAREASNEAVERRSELLAKYLEDHPELTGASGEDSSSSAAESWAATEEVNRRLAEVAAGFEEQLAAQRSIVNRYRYLSPALLVQEVFNDAAGTGDARFARFEDQVRDFVTSWRGFFVPAILAGQKLNVDAVGDRPAFSYAEERTSDIVDRTTAPLLALCLLAAALSTIAAAGLGRVRVR